MTFPTREVENFTVCSFVGDTYIVEKCGIREHSVMLKFARVVLFATWRLVFNSVLR
jgi:hypothetical protein